MSRLLTLDLYIQRDNLSAENISFWVHALLSLGFKFESEPWHSGSYWMNNDWYKTQELDIALQAFQQSNNWAVILWKRSVWGRDNLVDVNLSVVKPVTAGRNALASVGLSTRMPRRDTEPTLSQEFLAWSLFLADMVGPRYGWAGSSLGLFGRECTPVLESSLANLEVQPIEWLNIYGPDYIQKLGLSRLLLAPAWRVELLACNGIAIALGEHPDTVSEESATAVGKYLELPVP